MAEMGCVLRDQFRWEPHLSGPAPNYLLAEFLAGGGRLFRILAVSEINNMPKGDQGKISQWLAAPWSLLRGLWWNHRFHAPSARSRPMSVMRGLCWNHWFRPSCACVLAALPGNVVQEVRIELCDFCSLKKRDF